VQLWLDSEALKGTTQCEHWEDIPAAMEALCNDPEGNWIVVDRGEGARIIRDEQRKRDDIRKNEKYNNSQSGGGED
jgi:hypothetical protein